MVLKRDGGSLWISRAVGLRKDALEQPSRLGSARSQDI